MSDWDPLLQRIGDYADERYGSVGRKVFEELALSAASLKFRREYGLESDNVPMLRHPLLFGPTEHLKSSLPRRFVENLLPNAIERTEIHAASADVLEGSVNKQQVTPSVLSSADFCQIEFDSLSARGNADQIRAVLYKALNEGKVTKHLLSIDRAELDDKELTNASDQYGISINDTELQSPVDSLLIGVVHLESEFWMNNDEAFYRRWFPIYVEFEDGFMKEIREGGNTASMDPEPIREDMTAMLSTELDGGFNSAPPSLYDSPVTDALGVEGFRAINPLNVTLSAKALLDGKVTDGRVNWDEDDKEWLSDRITDQYRIDYNMYDQQITGNSTNDGRKAGRLETEFEILEHIQQNQPVRYTDLLVEFGLSKPTLARYLNDEDHQLSHFVEKMQVITDHGEETVLSMKTAPND